MKFIVLIFMVSVWSQYLSATACSQIKSYTARDEIKVATYNVLNLFDTRHDPGKKDHTFLPKSFPGKNTECQKIGNPYYRKECLNTDWTQDKFYAKLRQIKRVFDAQGDLPDILVLQEVENDFVVEQLGMLLGYDNYFVSESPDHRGIDVALLYKTAKLKLVDSGEIELVHEQFKDRPTRNILRVHFRLRNGSPSAILGVYVNHWPSLANPTYWRVDAAWALRETIEEYQDELGIKNYHVIALGDFNTLPSESPNPIESVLTTDRWSDHLEDAQSLSETSCTMPAASYWYRKKNRWQTLDRILISQNFFGDTGFAYLPDTFQIFDAEFMKTSVQLSGGQWAHGVPFRYNFQTTVKSKLGFSDHLPVFAKFWYQVYR